MQKFMYPSKFIRITQGYMEGTHAGSYAIDEAGSDGGKDFMIAPYSGTVKQIYSQYENEVFFESDEPVLFADGTVDYAVTMFVHQDSPMGYGMRIGKHYNQNDQIYIEGGRYKGQNGYFGSHCHLEFGRGCYSGSGWHKNEAGYYSLNNPKKPEECCFIDDSYQIIDSYRYQLRSVPSIMGNPITRDESQNQVEVLVDNLRCRDTPNGTILGYIQKGIYNYQHAEYQGEYWWYYLDQGFWIASYDGWTKIYPKKEEEDPEMIAELQNKIEEQNEKIELLNRENIELRDELSIVKKQNDDLKSIYRCKKEDYYGIFLRANEEVFIKEKTNETVEQKDPVK